jgi:type II secretory pathway pseudopilin PulG
MVTTLASGFITNYSRRVTIKGFTLIEAIVIIAIMAVIAGIATPVIFTVLERVETESAWEEMENIYTALMGDPEAGNDGYLGDMGVLPASLADLNSLGGPPYTMKSNGIGMGWNGPYLIKGKYMQDYLYDTWGTSYTYSFFYSNPSTGSKGEVLIRSFGPDKTDGTADDIEIRRTITTHQNIQINVYALEKGGWSIPDEYEGTLYYSNSGVEADEDFKKKKNDPAPVVGTVHKGLHAIFVKVKKPKTEGWKNISVGDGTTSVDVYLR